jgi:hypothetical protein
MATRSKCQRRKVVEYHVEPAEAWKIVVLNRWPGQTLRIMLRRRGERAKVHYTFVNVTAQSWSEQPPPRNPYKRKR